jgi:hypothetical protein
MYVKRREFRCLLEQPLPSTSVFRSHFDFVLKKLEAFYQETNVREFGRWDKVKSEISRDIL